MSTQPRGVAVVLALLTALLTAPLAQPAGATSPSGPHVTVGPVGYVQAGGAAVVVPLTVDCLGPSPYQTWLDVHQGVPQGIARRSGSVPPLPCDGTARTVDVLVDVPLVQQNGSSTEGYFSALPSQPFRAGAAAVLVGFGEGWAQVRLVRQRRDAAPPGVQLPPAVVAEGGGIAVRVDATVRCASPDAAFLDVRAGQVGPTRLHSRRASAGPVPCDGVRQPVTVLVPAEDRVWRSGRMVVSVRLCTGTGSTCTMTWRTVAVTAPTSQLR